MDAALDVLADHGVAGFTHRLVAARADVPLGSVTYHFATLGDLLHAAFARHVERQTSRFVQVFEHVETTEEWLETLVDLVCRIDGARRRDAVISFELYLAALRDPALRGTTQKWTSASRTVLARFTDASTAEALDALLEGMIMHALLSPAAVAPDQARTAMVRVLRPAEPPATTARE